MRVAKSIEGTTASHNPCHRVALRLLPPGKAPTSCATGSCPSTAGAPPSGRGLGACAGSAGRPKPCQELRVLGSCARGLVTRGPGMPSAQAASPAAWTRPAPAPACVMPSQAGAHASRTRWPCRSSHHLLPLTLNLPLQVPAGRAAGRAARALPARARPLRAVRVRHAGRRERHRRRRGAPGGARGRHRGKVQPDHVQPARRDALCALAARAGACPHRAPGACRLGPGCGPEPGCGRPAQPRCMRATARMVLVQLVRVCLHVGCAGAPPCTPVQALCGTAAAGAPWHAANHVHGPKELMLLYFEADESWALL